MPPRLKLLVVDDEADSRDALAAVLELVGHEVRTLGRGDQAVQACNEWRPDAVLLDIDLPDQSGYCVARQIRARNRRVMLIAITGWSADDGARRSVEAGFDAFFEKPLAIPRLNALLATLGRRQRTVPG